MLDIMANILMLVAAVLILISTAISSRSRNFEKKYITKKQSDILSIIAILLDTLAIILIIVSL